MPESRLICIRSTGRDTDPRLCRAVRSGIRRLIRPCLNDSQIEYGRQLLRRFDNRHTALLHARQQQSAFDCRHRKRSQTLRPRGGYTVLDEGGDQGLLPSAERPLACGSNGLFLRRCLQQCDGDGASTAAAAIDAFPSGK